MYIHKSACISHQKTFSEVDLNHVNEAVNKLLCVIEPQYEGIPLNILRRMGKAVRLGVGTAMPLINSASSIDGIIMGTANGGMEDCIKFLNQIVEYDEGRLTPTNFVQSTPNAVAAQIGLTTQNIGYNITHVHRGLAFENAMLDAIMMLSENPGKTYLLGGLDEISDFNYNIEYLADSYKDEDIDTLQLYNSGTKGALAGEGVAMFLVNDSKENAIAAVKAVKMIHTDDPLEVSNLLKLFLDENVPEGESPDLFLTGENGDVRLKLFYEYCEKMVDSKVGIARFKHFFGDFPSASALSLWLACEVLSNQALPDHFIKRAPAKNSFSRILIYNNYKGYQHSFMLVED